MCVCVFSHMSVFMYLLHVPPFHLKDLSDILSLPILIWQLDSYISVLLFWLEITISMQRGDSRHTGCWVYVSLVSIMHAYEYVYHNKSLGCCARVLSWLGTCMCVYVYELQKFSVATNIIYQIESIPIFLHPCPCPNTWSDSFLRSISSLLILWAVYFWVIFIHHYYNSLAVSLLLYSVFLLVFLSHLNSTRTTPSLLSSTQFIYTCNPACIHKHTRAHTHSYTQAQPSPTRTT